MRLNPFRSLPNPRQVWAWGMYDLANQSFTLLIVTLFYAIYFQNTVAQTPAQGKFLWGLANGLSAAVIVVLGPIFGAMADFGGNKKRWLMGLALGCATLTIALAFTGPGGPAMVWAALAVFVLANVMFMAGENFLAAFLPEIASRDTIGKVSAIGWTMGYVGALLVLPIAGLILHLTGQSQRGFQLVFLFAGLWFFLNALPTLFFLNEKASPRRPTTEGSLAVTGMKRVVQTARHIPQFRELAKFLGAFFCYSCGMTAIIAFSGELAFQYLGAGAIFLVYCCVVAMLAGAGSISTALLQGRLTQRALVAGSLALWLVVAVGAALLPPPGSPGAGVAIWLIGAGVGLGLGMTGNASRALFGVFTPAHKTAEFFGLWGLGYKLAGMVGPPVYGAVASQAGVAPAMLMLAGFYGVGLALLAFVDVPAGRRAAEDAERAHAREIDAQDLAAAARLGSAELRATAQAADAPASGPRDPRDG